LGGLFVKIASHETYCLLLFSVFQFRAQLYLMNELFDWCVKLLEDWARMTHMTYKEINIWIFVIIEPLIFVFMIFLIAYQAVKIKRLKRNANVTSGEFIAKTP
jgi:hypothetical protein